MGYNFNQKFQFGKYIVEIDTAANYGYFEHDELGDERGGGLWFDKRADNRLELTDYDGMACLPKVIITGLRENGFIVDEDFE